MIQDKATKVGCTAKLCAGGNNPSLAVCVYDVASVKENNLQILTEVLFNFRAVAQQGVIYESGNGVCTPTSAATDCTTYTPSTCDIDTGLCLKTDATTTAATTTAAAATTPSASSVVTPSGGTNTRCAQNSGMIDELRFLFRDMHNYRRSQTALGKTIKNTGRYLPQGSNMQFMRYDCNLEASAIQLAAACPSAATQSGTIIGQLTVSSVATWTDAVREIVKSWWRVVRQYNGPGMQVTFKTQHVGTPIASFTQGPVHKITVEETEAALKKMSP
ncbi:unnamed protein product [Heligmosomoides polygyrus]|uniref:SCP domain-containing protein n=1 Tax=Heligmosomoides polygyrus TaxID=6339 RepID=A0A183GAE5_HELPZ|nr:unnamed protein product [Heligmosomoides polygyrus]